MNIVDELDQLYEILSKYPLLEPPYRAEGNLIDDFNLRVNCYVDAINEISSTYPSNSIIKKIKNKKITITSFSDRISETLSYFLKGNIREAYSIFDLALTRTAMNSHLYKMTRSLTKICNEKKPLFRVRSSNSILKDRKELFHIPFEDRHRVSAMRFSVSGLPCLYLGSSIFVCWQEMGKPDFDKLYISSFITDEETQDLRILNLGYTLTSIVRTKPLDRFFQWDDTDDKSSETDELDEYDDNEISNNPYSSTRIDTIVSKLIAWPLVLACNYSKRHDYASFHQEYIIPNLLMQWISSDKNKDISGISYRSTKILNQKNNGIGLNIIIPPKMETVPPDTIGHCPTLKRTFSMTNPVSWTVFSTLEIMPKGYKGAKANFQSSHVGSKIENFDESLVELYDVSTFKKVELLIDQMMGYERLP
ncbi:hypothetical protein E9347_05200 [Salmonella enterica]|nr:hypothetical protein [Salmonella enterica]